MIYLDKIQAHLAQAAKNEQKAKECLAHGQPDKSNHYKRISEAHYRNADFYRKQSRVISSAIAF